MDNERYEFTVTPDDPKVGDILTIEISDIEWEEQMSDLDKGFVFSLYNLVGLENPTDYEGSYSEGATRGDTRILEYVVTKSAYGGILAVTDHDGHDIQRLVLGGWNTIENGDLPF